MDTNQMQKMFEQFNNTEAMGKMMQSPELKNLLANPDFMSLAQKMFDDDEDKEVINSMINSNNNNADVDDNIDADVNNSNADDNNNKYDSDDILLLENLKNESFNNQRVKVINYIKEKERYEVELLDESFDSKHILVKESNLESKILDTKINELEEVN